MNVYLVSRFYCDPSSVSVLAETGEKALKLVNKAYGYAQGNAYLIPQIKAQILKMDKINLRGKMAARQRG